MKEILFYSNNISEIIDIIKELGEGCNRIAPTPYGIRKHKFEIEVFDLNNQPIFNGYLFKDFKTFVEVLKQLKNGIIRYSCTPHPY